MSHSKDPSDYPRDLIGYGNKPPQPHWPNNARVAVNFVLNYEEGGEMSVLHGDEHAETFLSEIYGAEPFRDRHLSMESIYEYGSRAGLWRIVNEFSKRKLPLTFFAVAKALEKNPALVEHIKRQRSDNLCDVVCHGLRWIHYQNMPPEQEAAHMKEATELLTQLLGEPPLGWYTGRDSPNTRELLVEQGGYLFDSDYYGDDLPFWTKIGSQSHLVVPYTLDCNDMRFSSPTGFADGASFLQYLTDSFDVLYEEGESQPKMMSIGLHCRLVGRPGRFKALKAFLDYVQQHQGVWITTRTNIAKHWQTHHPAPQS
ncbi:MAG: allantoinase PuuE [Pontibacterium sp.]